jgi:secreted Zn-dependent insulinase-like peptidase
MSNLLQKSNRFQQDYQRYLDKIQQIPEGEFKQEANGLLNKLVVEVKKLDSMHIEMVITKQIPSMGSDMRQNILSIRQKLDNKLKNIG